MDSSKIICGAFSDALRSREENKHQKRPKFNNSFFDFIKISNHSASLCSCCHVFDYTEVLSNFFENRLLSCKYSILIFTF